MLLQKRNSRVKLKINKKKRYKLHSSLFGLKILSPVEVTQAHLLIIENLIKKLTLKKARVSRRLLFNKVKTKKPQKVRMGKGKGKIEEIVSQLLIGQIFLEINNITFKQAQLCSNAINKKMHLKVKVVHL